MLGYRCYLWQQIRAYKGRNADTDICYRDFAYAFVFGFSKRWAASLGKIMAEPPEWYEFGQTTGFEPVYYMMDIEKGMSGCEASMSSCDSSSGGGGSGGGAGGGGSGSW